MHIEVINVRPFFLIFSLKMNSISVGGNQSCVGTLSDRGKESHRDGVNRISRRSIASRANGLFIRTDPPIARHFRPRAVNFTISTFYYTSTDVSPDSAANFRPAAAAGCNLGLHTVAHKSSRSNVRRTIAN